MDYVRSYRTHQSVFKFEDASLSSAWKETKEDQRIFRKAVEIRMQRRKDVQVVNTENYGNYLKTTKWYVLLSRID